MSDDSHDTAEAPESNPPAEIPRGRGKGARLVLVVVLLGLAALALGAVAVSWTIPFQEWNAYSSGTWSMLIYQGAGLLPPEVDPILRQSPLVYVGEGLIWKAIGSPAMWAARTYSLAFSVLLVLATYWLARPAPGHRLAPTLAAFLAAGSPLLTEEVSSTLCDIPAAAMLWLGFLSLRRARARPGEWRWWLLGGTSFALALLSKTTVIPLVALFLVHAALRTQWRGLRDFLVAAAALAAPLAVTAIYFVSIRGDLPWRYFLFEWAARYYSNMAAGSRADNLAQVRWFGVFLSALLVAAAAARVSGALRAARWWWDGWTAVIVAGAAAYIVFGTRILTTVPFRPQSYGFSDRWVAGTPAVIAILALLLYSIRGTPSGRDGDRESLRILVPVVLFGALWWWKLGYDTRFLILVLPPAAVFVGGWIANVIERASRERQIAITVCVLAVLVAAGYEGARRMDRGFPVFSSDMIEINRKDGPSPDAKMVDIFGESARVMRDLQEMVRKEPRIAMVSPDNRLKFFLGRNVSLLYPREPSDLAPFQVLVWVNNPDVRARYRDSLHIPDPLGHLNSTGLLTPVSQTPEYEVYRIGAPAPTPSAASTP
jgi:4-amino-4-deoxy-L-arabinose transferase-like glycosyltransferase